MREKNSVIFLKQDPWELFSWLTVWQWKNLYKQWELTAPNCHWKQVSANHHGHGCATCQAPAIQTTLAFYILLKNSDFSEQFWRFVEWSCSDCGNTVFSYCLNVYSQLQNSLSQYVAETSSTCQNGYSWEITLQFYYWLLVEGPGNMVKILL